MQIHADRTKPAVVHGSELPWTPSPSAGVDRRMLEREGEEVARATTIVRYAPESRFPSHRHDLGEEFLVLEGVFSDESGDFPVGSYVRNPPGSSHAPASESGCTILVKLRQMDPEDRERVVVDTRSSEYRPAGDGIERLELFSTPGSEASGERVSMLRVTSGSVLELGDEAGDEVFVVEGNLERTDDGTDGPPELDELRAWTWLRLPPGERVHLRARQDSLVWRKIGHLAD